MLPCAPLHHLLMAGQMPHEYVVYAEYMIASLWEFPAFALLGVGLVFQLAGGVGAWVSEQFDLSVIETIQHIDLTSRIDALVNNAAILHLGPLEGMEPGHIDATSRLAELGERG